MSDCSNYNRSGTHPGLRMIGNHRIIVIHIPFLDNPFPCRRVQCKH